MYGTSSSITAKILETSKRMANPESEFLLGLLIFEDLVAPIAVAILVSLTSGTGITGLSFFLIVLKIVGLIVGAVVIGNLIFSRLGGFVDRYLSQDVFILLVVGIALSYGGLALLLNLSEVLGAFLAGIILAEVKRTEVLEHLVLQVRDLFLPLFFFYFGTTIAFGGGVPMLPLLISYSLVCYCKNHYRIFWSKVLWTIKKSVFTCRLIIYSKRRVFCYYSYYGCYSY